VRGRFHLQSGSDCFENAFRIADYIVVPKSQDPIVAFVQPLVPRFIDLACKMLPAVDFDNKATLAAYEIDNVAPDRLLSHEFATGKTARSKPIPEKKLGFGGIEAQSASALRLCFVCTAHAATPPHPTRFARRPLPACGER
jgi:hypothetical protein